MELEYRLEEMSNKCDRTNTSLNYTKKENYQQFDHTKDFTTFYNNIENQLITVGLAEFVTYKFLPIDLLDPFQSIDNRVFRNALELKEKMKSVVNKIYCFIKKTVKCSLEYFACLSIIRFWIVIVILFSVKIFYMMLMIASHLIETIFITKPTVVFPLFRMPQPFVW